VASTSKQRRQAAVFLLVVGLALSLTAGVARAHEPAVKVVMSGLDNPRGLALSPFGALYVAEAGRGGDGPCAIVMGREQCYGPTGAISRLWFGQQRRVVTGLPSLAAAGGAEATGPHDIALQGLFSAYVTTGLGPVDRAAFGEAGADLGKLLQVRLFTGGLHEVADIYAYEVAVNPGGGPIDSNPYGLLAGNGRIVTDAGVNALLRVSRRGDVSTLATFPARPQGRPTDSVPTSVARGPDGALYVGELTGAPFAAGSANIYRVVPDQPAEVFLTGFKTVIDLAFDRHGSLFVLQHATGPLFFSGPGELIRVDPDGTRTTILREGLVRPTSLVIARSGAIYVTNNGIAAGAGEVIRVTGDNVAAGIDDEAADVDDAGVQGDDG